jgi:serine/threonine-protein kinase HipA
MTGSLGVWYGERRVGALLRQRSGGIRFTYAASWLEDPAGFAISVSLPLEASPSHPPAAHAFFANLLPEGRVREAVARQLGLSVDNDFAILEAIGGECAGALAVLPAEAHPAGGPSTYAPLPPEAIAAMARRASVLAEVSGGRGTRLSLAGAQDKLPVRRDPDGAL